MSCCQRIACALSCCSACGLSGDSVALFPARTVSSRRHLTQCPQRGSNRGMWNTRGRREKAEEDTEPPRQRMQAHTASRRSCREQWSATQRDHARRVGAVTHHRRKHTTGFGRLCRLLCGRIGSLISASLSAAQCGTSFAVQIVRHVIASARYHCLPRCSGACDHAEMNATGGVGDSRDDSAIFVPRAPTLCCSLCSVCTLLLVVPAVLIPPIVH